MTDALVSTRLVDGPDHGGTLESPGTGLRAWLLQFRREVWAVGAFSGVANLMMLVPTLYMLQVYDRVLLSGSELTLLAVSVFALCMYGVMAFAEWFRGQVLVRAGVRMSDLLAERVFRASFDAHIRRPGMHPGRPLSDLTELRQFLTGSGPITVFDAPWAPVYLGVLFLLHPMLGWAGIFFALFQSAVAWALNRHSIAPTKALGQLQQESVGQIQAKLKMSEAVQSMGMLTSLFHRWQIHQGRYMRQHAIAHGRQNVGSVVSKGLRYAQQSLMLGLGALLVIDGELSAGAMIAANALASRALAPIDQLVGSWKGFASAYQAYGRLSALLADHGFSDPALTRVPPEGDVRLVGVSANAPTAESASEPIIQDVDLLLKCGEITVVMGPSGSGKSTLAKVLLGIWPASGGQVLWGDRPFDGWTPEDRGAQVGYLAQDVELFDGSIAENIARMGKVDSEKVIAAAQLVGLHETILRFGSGYDTAVSSAGGTLSGGQRQRLGLAQAVYGHPRLVVLDEPNANLDDSGESALTQALSELKASGAAIMVISHRSAVLSVADRLVWMQDGRVVHSGDRDAVLSVLKPVEPTAATKA